MKFDIFKFLVTFCILMQSAFSCDENRVNMLSRAQSMPFLSHKELHHLRKCGSWDEKQGSHVFEFSSDLMCKNQHTIWTAEYNIGGNILKREKNVLVLIKENRPNLPIKANQLSLDGVLFSMDLDQTEFEKCVDRLRQMIYPPHNHYVQF